MKPAGAGKGDFLKLCRAPARRRHRIDKQAVWSYVISAQLDNICLTIYGYSVILLYNSSRSQEHQGDHRASGLERRRAEQGIQNPGMQERNVSILWVQYMTELMAGW